ncbi:LysR family transcriptional regulator [Schaedlerella sp.]|jgi:DNA-binding transcriptional LysR family regulator|uniref:LysR family transcriptional regulator n=1 Tax=Schaedlerella sp. TaxID=2676057 RepID=UPI003528F5A5
MMYNPQLETFICVVDSGSFSKAAEKLYITAPAVIKQINSLESSLDLHLFERTHRGLIVTEAGKSLYQDAKYLIQYCKDSVSRARNAQNNQEGVIRIGVSPMTPSQVFMTLWPRIQKYCPDLKFKLVPFENTPENAREILGNLEQNIDVIAGIFDDTMLSLRKCSGMQISKEPFCCAVALHHRLAGKETLTMEDLYGENMLLIQRGWSKYVDILRDDLRERHPQIQVIDFEFYNLEVFNRCENSNDVLLAIKNWESVHPLMKIIPVEWNYSIPYGLLYSMEPSEKVKKLLSAAEKAIAEGGMP